MNAPLFWKKFGDEEFVATRSYKDEQCTILHNPSEPAWVDMFDNVVVEQRWYFNGELHNPHGPAWVINSQTGRSINMYYLHGVRLPHELWKSATN